MVSKSCVKPANLFLAVFLNTAWQDLHPQHFLLCALTLEAHKSLKWLAVSCGKRTRNPFNLVFQEHKIIQNCIFTCWEPEPSGLMSDFCFRRKRWKRAFALLVWQTQTQAFLYWVKQRYKSLWTLLILASSVGIDPFINKSSRFSL